MSVTAENANREILSQISSTCVSTTENTSQHGTNKRRNKQSEETKTAESDMQLIPHIVKSAKTTQGGRQKNAGSKRSKPTESALSDTTSCWQNPNGNARSAELNIATQHESDFISTTAIGRGKSGGFCARSAIQALVNSGTVSSCWEKHNCTCEKRTPIRLISKPTIFGFGLNFQHCRRMVFIGLSYSYEQYYQAVRRCWRFGQQSEVHAHVVMAESEAAILRTNERKQSRHTQMQQAMRTAINRKHELATGADLTLNQNDHHKRMEMPQWLCRTR